MARTTKEKKARKSANSASAEKRKTQKTTKASKGKGAKPTPATERSKATKGCGKPSKSSACTPQRSQTSRSTPGANAQSQQAAPKVAKVHIGSTIKTKDKYLPYDPKNVQELKERRWVVVIDKNTNEELAVVRLTDEKQRNTTELPTYKKGNKRKTYFKHFVEIEDNEGNAICVDGKKFLENAAEYDLSKKEMRELRDKVLNHSKQSSENRNKILILKNKKPRD